MTVEERLASIHLELLRLAIPNLIMGGHAVRYYGVDRSTLDFDLRVMMADEQWQHLGDRLAISPIFATAIEGPSRRPHAFRRFVIGTLEDGREERLEFWRKNHLLAPWDDAWSRREEGTYGGARLAFFGIDDLLRSKETEREDDWRDIRLLEEIADERGLARASKDDAAVLEAISRLRSQRGFERALHQQLLEDGARVKLAVVTLKHPVTAAFLIPYANETAPSFGPLIDPVLRGPLRKVAPGSLRHRALVEAVRRLYQRLRMDEDRVDKERDQLDL